MQKPYPLMTEDVPVDSKVTIAGWGRTDYADLSNQLQKIETKVISKETRRRNFGKFYDKFDGMIFTFVGQGTSACLVSFD